MISLFESPRRLLLVLISLISMSSIFISGVSIYLILLFYPTKESQYGGNGAVDWIGISICGITMFSMTIIGLRGTHLVNLELLLTYFWGITVYISGLTLAVVVCLDSYSYLGIWINHEWGEASLRTLREQFCIPSNTADTKCMAPLHSSTGNVTEWCIAEYNATDCQPIRDKAIAAAIKFGSGLTLSMSLVGIATIVIILLSIYICYKILTAPVITQSMNDVINYLLLLPIAGCIGIAYHLYAFQQQLYYATLADLFVALAVSQFVALPLGIAAGRLKSQLMITAYVVIIALITLGFIAAGVVGLSFANLINETFKPSPADTAHIACQRELGCCCCNTETGDAMCPEWSQEDVITIMALDFKVAGFVAIVSVIYLLGALTVGLLVRRNLKDYKWDYV